MTTVTDFGLPVGLHVLVRKPPLLNGESKEDYFALMGEMVNDIGPSDAPEYIWVINFTNWTWELSRHTNARAVLIDSKIPQVLRSLCSANRNLSELDPGPLLQNFRTILPRYGVNPDLVTSTAVARASSDLEYLDKTIAALQRRCDAILQLLEGRRDVFAARARQKAAETREREFHRARMDALNSDLRGKISNDPDSQDGAKRPAITPALPQPTSK